jgi:hypothetical protein
MNYKLNFISNSKKEKFLEKKLIFVFIFNLLLLFFLISFVFSQNLKSYILKQIVNISDEKYIINSLGKISFGFSNLGVDINIYKVNYVVYKEIENELIRLSSNYFENVSTNLKKLGSYNFKSDNNPKFDTYFYPFFYIFAVLYFDKDNKLNTKTKLKLNDSVLNIVKIQNNIIEFQEIYKNEIISNGKLYKKSNQNFKLILNYNVNGLKKEEKDNLKRNINLKGSYVEIEVR